MPIYEYKCEKCGNVFEKLSKTNEKTATCPKCLKKAKKIFSSFSAKVSSSSSTGSCCPSGSCCSSGACSLGE
jgi:putative FmdB family regulatory protein